MTPLSTPAPCAGTAVQPVKDKLRFITTDGTTEIRAKLKATGQWATFGFCHPASVRLIKADGIRRHLHLIRIP